jgi:hypothetical protein
MLIAALGTLCVPAPIIGVTLWRSANRNLRRRRGIGEILYPNGDAELSEFGKVCPRLKHLFLRDAQPTFDHYLQCQWHINVIRCRCTSPRASAEMGHWHFEHLCPSSFGPHLLSCHVCGASMVLIASTLIECLDTGGDTHTPGIKLHCRTFRISKTKFEAMHL